MKHRLFAAVLACLTLVSTTAFSQNPRQGRHRGHARLFQRADTDHDGRISSDERKRSPEGFNRLDQNHDGFITQDEAQAAGRAGKRHGRRRLALRRMDTDNDGRITRDEWRGPAELFDRLDANHDGAVTRDEARQGRRRKAN